ncbi:MAG: hypothetical protein B7Y35_15765 [Sphingomonadales bacterium 28-64-96]|nr:MAG: hypothetical protein B7Y35_15765 [Sphingomonadales bacterium 28-64-96]
MFALRFQPLQQRAHDQRQFQRFAVATMAVRKRFNPLADQVRQVRHGFHIVCRNRLLAPYLDTVKRRHFIKRGRINRQRVERGV